MLTDREFDQGIDEPCGVAWVPSQPDWLITTEVPHASSRHRVKVTNARTGATVCTLGETGEKYGQFFYPRDVAVTADGSFVVVADTDNHRVQVLKLIDRSRRPERPSEIRPLHRQR